MLRDFDTAHGLRSVLLRYFNAAGADPDGETGEVHDPETHLIPLVLDAAIGKRPSITVYGNDYDTPDGTCIRDYIHVTDLAEAHILALELLLKESSTSTAYNLSNGHGFSVRQIVEAAKLITGRKIPEKIGSRRKGDPPVLIGDSTRIDIELGWKPRLVSLNDIIETAMRFHKQINNRH